MSKTNKIFLILVIILVIVLIGLFIYQWQFSELVYHAVYLRTGELYFGQLTRFPSFGLKQVYHLQANLQDQQTPFSIQKFTNVVWGPEDFLKINPDQVVWTAKLNSASQLLQVIQANPNLAPTPTP